MRTLKGGSARKRENHCSKGIFVHYVCSGPQHAHADAVHMQMLCTCRRCSNECAWSRHRYFCAAVTERSNRNNLAAGVCFGWLLQRFSGHDDGEGLAVGVCGRGLSHSRSGNSVARTRGRAPTCRDVPLWSTPASHAPPPEGLRVWGSPKTAPPAGNAAQMDLSGTVYIQALMTSYHLWNTAVNSPNSSEKN